MSTVKLVLFGMAAAVSVVLSVGAQTQQQKNVIENTVAVQVASSECGYKINLDMLALVLSAVDIRTSDMQPGGRFRPEVIRNQERVRDLVSTRAGKESFCRNARAELSAMFD